MHFTVKRNDFFKALSHSNSVVEKRTTVPILAYALLSASEGQLQITSTDLEISLLEPIPAQVQTPGKITVPVHMLFDIVRKLPDSHDLTFQFDESTHQTNLSCGRSRFKLPSLPAEDFPAIQPVELPHTFSINSALLQRLIERTRFAMSTEETRFYLNGIYLHAANDKEFRAVATDGHRLARIAAPLPAGAEQMPAIILPRKTVGAVLPLIEAAPENTTLSLSSTQVCFQIGPITIISRLIDGKFPEYEGVIPYQNNKILNLPIKPFAEAVDRVATVSNDRMPGVRMSVDNGNITLFATNAENGTGREELEISYNAEPIEIGFNARYLLEITQHLEGEYAHFAVGEADAPVLIRDGSNDDAIYILMPMRV